MAKKSKRSMAERLQHSLSPVTQAKYYTKGVFSVLPKKERTKARYDKTFTDFLLGRK